MIVVCEPLCKEMSHEKVNSGFLYGLSLAFPGETIRLYAHASHVDAIKRIIAHDKIQINSIEYKTISFGTHSPLVEVIRYYFVFYRMFLDVLKNRQNKIFFLSFSPTILYAIKKLKTRMSFSHLKFTLVLHGAYETIADDDDAGPGIILPRKSIPAYVPSIQKSFLAKVSQTKFTDVPVKIWNRIRLCLPTFSLPFTHNLSQFFTVKKMMELEHSDDFRYIALSPHITKNSQKYLDIKKFNFYSIILPTFFSSPKVAVQNEHAKFAIFGYGNALVLHNILAKLAQKNIKKPYEIRIIGMDSRGTEGFSNVTSTSNGRRLEREEMEKHAEDIDAFLILYDKTKYRLSCSGSILESLSYVKPIIHFDNDCINQFNTQENPIGLRNYSLDEYTDKIEDVIENYDNYKKIFENFRDNILKKRDENTIEKSVPELKKSFTW